MKDIQIFNNPEFGQVRTVVIDDEPWFVGKDVAGILGYKNPNEAIHDHVDSEDKFLRSERGREMLKLFSSVKEMQDELGRQDNWFINESGVYSLVFGSKLESAKKFKHWITSEVLPAIRKTGGYQKPLSQLEILQGSINQLVEQNKRLSRVEMKQEEQDRQMSHINTSIEVLNGVCTEGTKRDRLNAMVRAYANKAGLTYPTAWHKFCEAFNFAFHTNIGLPITNYMKKQAINKKMSTPVYLEAAERLDDALRVAEKMLNSLPGKVARA